MAALLISFFLIGLPAHFCKPVSVHSADNLSTAADASSEISAQIYADKGYQHFYNLEFHDAAEAYRKAIEMDRKDSAFWTGLADSYLFQALVKSGRLDGNLYTASNEFLNVLPAPPDPALVQAMWDALRTARDICQERIARNPRDAAAHYSMAVSHAIEANFQLNLARRNFEALSVSGRARDHAKLALEANPELHDAKLVLGAYEYAIGSVPAAFRWLLVLGGHSGSKEHGVELIQQAMLRGKRAGPAALAMLGLVYSREQLYPYSRQMWQQLHAFFPRNYLAELEVARTFYRENNLGAALDVYRNVERKMDSGAPGYDRVDAERLHFQLGSLYERKDRSADALISYGKVAALHNPGGRLQAQSYLRMGEIYLRLQQKDKAREMFQKAAALPFPEVRREASARLKVLK
ncbi:MAG TPA: tetratricopeptide repeat protein [Candidatus Nitrosotenuis sp.]|nr:tetratricopeptide repeat protein [Candidatus Nitrosotenuis sp.]